MSPGTPFVPGGGCIDDNPAKGDAMGIGTVAETAVLAVLAAGGMLTADQITRDARLPEWCARRAIGQLESRGLIMATPYAACWSITPRGVAVAQATSTSPDTACLWASMRRRLLS